MIILYNWIFLSLMLMCIILFILIEIIYVFGLSVQVSMAIYAERYHQCLQVRQFLLYLVF